MIGRTSLEGEPIRPTRFWRWHPAGERVRVCLSSNNWYRCRGCRRYVCACNGAADDMPLHCDDCWAKAQARGLSGRP